MDTWATSSLTPQLAGGWERDPELFDLVFPFSMRPQGQDIIRTWLFSTVLRAELEHGTSPWKTAAISGWILDPDRKKMSKSKGNVVTPAATLEQFGSDAVRYWAASARLGVDAAMDPQNPTQIKIGRRLAIKVLNAAKFILSFEAPADARATHAIDVGMLAALAEVVETATQALEEFDHARALEVTESFFWTFCDDYLELVKDRAYSADADPADRGSAVAALREALDVLLRLFAPFVPFAAEEAWSWSHDGSVHTAPWPTAPAPDAPTTGGTPDARLLALAGRALVGIRRAKTDAKASQKTPVAEAVVAASADDIRSLELVARDLRAVGRITDLTFIEGDGPAVARITLAPVEQPEENRA
jgi:valyl-tRNA synthetase